MMRSIVPGYIETGNDAGWSSTLARCAPGSIVVINPANGPGAAWDAGWASRVAQIRSAGCQAFGYVHCRRGGRAGELVPDIDRYARFYGADGIFIDEFPSQLAEVGDEQLAHLAAAILYARRVTSPRRDSLDASRVVVNPGTMPSGDIVTSLPTIGVWVIHEDRDPNGPSIDDVTGPGSNEILGPLRRAWLTYADPAPDATMARLVELGWRWGWSTDDPGPLGNPWDANPAT